MGGVVLGEQGGGHDLWSGLVMEGGMAKGAGTQAPAKRLNKSALSSLVSCRRGSFPPWVQQTRV